MLFLEKEREGRKDGVVPPTGFGFMFVQIFLHKSHVNGLLFSSRLRAKIFR